MVFVQMSNLPFSPFIEKHLGGIWTKSELFFKQVNEVMTSLNGLIMDQLTKADHPICVIQMLDHESVKYRAAVSRTVAILSQTKWSSSSSSSKSSAPPRCKRRPLSAFTKTMGKESFPSCRLMVAPWERSTTSKWVWDGCM